MENNKHLSEQEIALCAEAIVNGTFSQLDEKYQKHLSECDICANEVNMVSSICEEEKIMLSQIERKVSENKKSTRNITAVLVWGAAASIILLLGVKFLSNNQVTNTHSNTVAVVDTAINNSHKTDSVIPMDTLVPEKQLKIEPKKEEEKEIENVIIKPDKKVLLAYATHADLEKMVKRFESGNMRGSEIKILSPIEIKSNAKDLKLDWENVDGQTLFLELFDNKGNLMSEIELTESGYKPKEIWQDGLYYWKLINEDFDLLFCGKIIIK